MTTDGTQIRWLRWDAIPIAEAAKSILDLATDPATARSAEVDLAGTVVVVPGRRAGTMLLWHLEEEAAQRGLLVVPPRVATPGTVADALEPPLQRVATALERERALVTALRRSESTTIGSGRGAQVGTRDSASRERTADFAALIRAIEDELHGVGRTLADAAECAPDSDRGQWRRIVAAAATAATLLAKAGLALPWLVQRSGQVAGGDDADGGPDRIVLALVAELPVPARRAIESSIERGVHVVAMVHAPPDMHDAFDRLGLLRAGSWMSDASERPEAIALDRVIVTDGPMDAAQVTIDGVLAASTDRAADEIVIGLVDATFGPALELGGAWSGIPLRLAAGRSIRETQAWRFLGAASATLAALETSRTSRHSVAPGVHAMVRLPCIGEWLRRRRVIRSAADAPAIVDEGAGDAMAIVKALVDLLSPLRCEARCVQAWAEPIRAVLADALQFADAEPPEEDAAAAIAAELAEWSELPASVDDEERSAAEAVEWLTERLSERRVPDPVRRDTIETLGWLELHADDAPVLIVLGMHEGKVPQATGAHPLMTPQMRSALGLADAASRAARDAYLLDAMVQGRDRVTAIVARRSSSGDPIVPSRLLLRGPDGGLARRVLHLTGDDGVVTSAQPRGLPPAAATTGFIVPSPSPNPPMSSMRVTDFARCLACGYRFWLQRVLRLAAHEAVGAEMDALDFGTLVHGVLADFGLDKAASGSTDADRIAAFLDARLAERIRADHGSSPSAAIRVQADRIQERLHAFARWQASHRRAGWCIDRIEWELPETAALAIPAEERLDAQPPMRLRGRIDRIDVHPNDGVLLIDYKTSAGGRDPRATHLGGKKADGTDPSVWRDLQLPLYRHLLESHEPGRSVATGYVLLPRDTEATGLAILDIDDDEYAVALRVARDVVRAIRSGDFPLSDRFTGHDEFAAICQANAFVADESDDTTDENGSEESE